jgi:enoyl-CoA hydratase/carnithine racemase
MTSVAPKTFLYVLDRETGVATLTLNRPERLNALTFEVYAELRDTFAALDAEPAVKAVILTGAGRGFCSGGDVEDIIGALFGRDAEGLLEFTTMTCDVVRNIRRCRKPVIAALNGTVAGAGAVIAAACDLRWPRSRRVSPSCSCGSGSPAPTWARRGCCRASSGSARRPSCS